MLCFCCMALQERFKSLTGNKRTFLLMRIAGLDADFSMKLTSVTRGTYNSWFKNEEFALLYHELPTLIQDHRLEAVQMLRKDNQLEAVLLEGKIIARIKEEIDTGIYLDPKINCLLRDLSRLGNCGLSTIHSRASEALFYCQTYE